MTPRLLLVVLLFSAHGFAQELPTVAESSGYRATARHAEVVEFCRRLDESSDHVRLVEVGRTKEDRAIPALVLADPSIDGPEAAAKAGKLVVVAYAGIHAGEICGKEAFLALARDLVRGPDVALLEHLVVVLVPIYNADGNERVRKDNRPGQVGPDEGMGTRANAMGLDLNRDFVKLEAPETRALVRFLGRWKPAIVVDSHTTDGSRHRYTMTWDSPRHPSTHPDLLAFARDEFLPEVGRQLEAASGYAGFFYGNFAEGDVWETYPAWPRYGTHYLGATHRIGILAEAYAYASFQDRVLATRGFVLEILRRAAASRDRIRELVAASSAARAETIHLRCKSVALGEPRPVRGEEGERTCAYLGLAEPTLSTTRPYAYLVDPALEGVVQTLQRHGIGVEELREDLDLDLEVDRVDRIERAERPFEGHEVALLAATRRTLAARVKAGTFVVRTDQPLGTFAALLLEAQAEDGLAAWNVLDPHVAEGADYPVRRLPAARTLVTRRARALPEDRGPKRRLTFDLVHDEDRPLDLAGNPVRIARWEGDEHFVQSREGKTWKVEARTGRAELLPEPDLGPATKALQAALGLDEKKASRALGRAIPANDPARGRLVRHEKDLWLAGLDGQVVRLTNTPAVEELVPTFSPDDRLVAFVAEGDLHVVEAAGGEPRALTTDGEGPVANGYLDWVYEEEVYGRGNRRGFWWSPDSTRLAFLQVDDRPVPSFTIVDDAPMEQAVEATNYPRPGEPNPIVRLGTVAAAGGEVEWADLSAHDPAAILVTGVGWFPDSKTIWFHVQDRIQSWLEMQAFVPGAPGIRKLLADRNGHWVDPPGEPRFLSDGSFLLASERTGWRHLYRYAADGTAVGQVTSGDWEVRDLLGVDETEGWVYATGMRDDPVADHLYRARLDGSYLERLTFERGSHRIDLSPGAKLFVDSWESSSGPTQVVLRRSDGAKVRTLDANPVHEIESWELGRIEHVRIPAEGVDLAGLVVYPPDFDPGKKYPVWFKTYGGPHAPSVRDGWYGGRLRDRQLAAMGFVVFYADPRSASGRGAVSTWTAYKQLGVPELADVETAIRWIAKQPWVDPARIGMSGHSYGGFLTAYALTHSRLFAAGIAGAPVTDWRLYDTIYTERYMDTPQANPEGYDRTSVVKAAKDLHGRLLLVHGGFDDNVHAQNTWMLVDALQRADKDFELMVYPRHRHGINGRHYQRLVVDFMVRTLRPERDR